MEEKKNTKFPSLGIGEILGIVFVILKLCHVIDWAWIWVLSPIWIGFIVCCILYIILYSLK